jgi:hypothetical protein
MGYPFLNGSPMGDPCNALAESHPRNVWSEDAINNKIMEAVNDYSDYLN